MTSRRPNLLLITSDQHRADCYGFAGRAVQTPHLDQFAAEGTHFNACITPNVVCQPSRASILTGLCSVVALVAVLPASPASAQSVYTVSGTGDGRDANPGDGRCRTASGNCTLRAAIDESNATPGSNTITFDIPGSGVKTEEVPPPCQRRVRPCCPPRRHGDGRTISSLSRMMRIL